MTESSRSIVPSFVVQEEGAHKVFVYLDIPELKVKRSFPNLLKFIPANAHEKTREFENQSFTYTIHVQSKLYSLAIRRLPGEIHPERCSIKYQRGGCWITLIKSDSTPWMNRICCDFNPGLDITEETNEPPSPSAPQEEVQLKDTDMPPPFNAVPLAPCPPPRPPRKAPAPPPPTSPTTN